MRRFLMNRWWTFVLALFVSVASVGSIAPMVRADGTSQYGDDTDTRTPNPQPNPQGTGDPDFPSTPGMTKAKPGSMRLGAPSAYSVSASGEGMNVGTRMWLMRFRVAMRLLKAYYLR